MKNITKAIELLADKTGRPSQCLHPTGCLQENTDERLKDLQKAIEADATNSDAWQARVCGLVEQRQTGGGAD